MQENNQSSENKASAEEGRQRIVEGKLKRREPQEQKYQSRTQVQSNP